MNPFLSSETQFKLIFAALLLAGPAGCHIGLPAPAPRVEGPVVRVRTCVSASEDVSREYAAGVLDGWNRKYETNLGVRFELAEFAHRERPWRFLWDSRWYEASPRLEAPCDRQLYLTSGTLTDFALGLLSHGGLPVILGAVDDPTGTVGVVQTSWVAPGTMLLNAWTPQRIAEHELFHLLGCPHAYVRTTCYRRIAELRTLRAGSGEDFFPARGPVDLSPVLRTRVAVNTARCRADRSMCRFAGKRGYWVRKAEEPDA